MERSAMFPVCGFGILLLGATLFGAGPGPALFPIERNGLTGFIDRQGKMVIPPRFDPMYNETSTKFAEGLQPVSIDGKWGYIDAKGIVRIAFTFVSAGDFSEGLAAVARNEKMENGLYRTIFGYIDHSGEWAISPEFEEAGPFSNGVARIVKNGKVEYVAKNGVFVPSPQSEKIFSEGLAAFRDKELWGFVDTRGEWVIPPKYNDATSFQEGVARVCLPDKYSSCLYIDRTGKAITEPYDFPGPFSDGLARISRNQRVAFINRKGEIQFTLDANMQAEDFHEGLAKVTVRNSISDQVGYIDHSGHLVIPPIYQVGSQLRDGLIYVYYCGQTGYIDSTGKPVFGIVRKPPPSGIPPVASLITAEIITKMLRLARPVTLESVPVSATCDLYGKKIWSMRFNWEGNPLDPIVISLLEAGSYLTEERLEFIQSSREKLRKLGPYGASSAEEMYYPIRRDSTIAGWATVAGFGPGGAGYVASVFSPGQEYEVQVLTGATTVRGAPAKTDPISSHPIAFTAKLAENFSALLFSGR